MEQVELTPGDAADLTELYAEYGWWDDRTVDEVREALANTPVAVGLRDDGDLVAAARVITDRVYYAKVYDVIVAADRRGEGVGARLMEAVVHHPALDDVNPVLTCRRGLVDFYERFGFDPYPETVEVPDGDDEALHHLVWSPGGEE